MTMRGSFLVVVALAAVAASHTRGAQPSVHVLGTLMPEEAEPESMTIVALRAEISRLRKKLDECEANCAPSPNKPAQHQRALSATPAPTPLTPIPSIGPSVSLTPTSMAWFELAAAVADATNEEIFVEADVMFPSQSPISIDSDRSVSIVGRSAEDGGRVTLDGLSDSRFFIVDGGALHLTFLNLVNGSAPEPDRMCQVSDGDYSCLGGAIIVKEDGQLVVSSCDIRGPGRHDVYDAWYGGGVYVHPYRTTVSFSNVTFEGLNAPKGAAVDGIKSSDDGIPSVFTFRHCHFLRNFAVDGVLILGPNQILVDLDDCQFLNNKGKVVLAEAIASVWKIRRCTFRDNSPTNTETLYFGQAVYFSFGGQLDIVDSIFEKNVGFVGSGGALHLANSAHAIVINSTFIANSMTTVQGGGAFSVGPGCILTLICCYARANTAPQGSAGTFLVTGGTLIVRNSTVTESSGNYAGVGYFSESADVIMERSVFTNSRASQLIPGFQMVDKSSLSMTDCIHRDAEPALFLAYFYTEGLCTVYALRCIFQDLRATTIGPVYLRAATGYFEDCDFIDNYVTTGSGGTFFLRPGGELVVKNSRISRSSAVEGSVAWLDVGSFMRIVGSTITNISGDAAFAIHDESGDDFAVQFDTVTVDESVNIFSNSSVLLQNCDGFSSASVKKADIATCESTSDFCIPSSCMDVTSAAGIHCICTAGGVEVPFPTDCMQSAVIAVPLPSTRTLTYLINKPFNESAELLLANVRMYRLCVLRCVVSLPDVCVALSCAATQTGESMMSWELTNSSDDPGEIEWFASPTSGEVDAFGEALIEVITRSTGLNARDAPYVATFLLHSDDVCVCRSQTVQMIIRLVVTAETSAANSYIEIIGSNNVEASGELTFYIVPVDDEGLLIRDSGAVQFSPVITWVGHHGQTVRRRRPLDEIVVVCSVKFITALDVHEGTCRMPTLDGAPLAGSFALSAELASGEQVGGSDYSVEVTSCPKDWFYHKPTGACQVCDLEKSECRGGRELPVPKRGYWSDLANADLGFVCATMVPDDVAWRLLVQQREPNILRVV